MITREINMISEENCGDSHYQHMAITYFVVSRVFMLHHMSQHIDNIDNEISLGEVGTGERAHTLASKNCFTENRRYSHTLKRKHALLTSC